MIKKLLKRFNIDSFSQFVQINLVFAITGSLSVVFSGLLMDFFHINDQQFSPLIYWPIRIIFVFFCYQILLLLVAIPFGQFRYFLDAQKRVLRKLGLKLE